MKRHPHLVPLSDDHHDALVLARRSRRTGESGGSPEISAQTWSDVQRRFARKLEPHFRVEEEWLLPQLESAGETALVERTRADHASLRALVAGAASRERLLAFGKLLHDHVRFEERELFACAQRVLPDSVLEAVGRAALAARE